MHNSDNLLAYIEIYKKNLDRVSQYLRADDAESLKGISRRARTLREGIGQD